ncbi:MAG TPA: LysM peptidoglycan-binding domain-containing protein [Chlamydiales bacterium]|nr:LysM peptidoglycan-binding domain-containing protein [Chlamydiales bacterium]
MQGNFTDWQAKAKWLAQILIISVTINVGLVATLCYFAVRGKKNFTGYEMSHHEKRPRRASLTQTNEEVLGAFSLLAFDDLLRMLKDDSLVEEGYTKRDLALTCLVSMHHFDLDRALPHLNIKPKQATFLDETGADLTLTFYPNMNDKHFEVIKKFAKREKYPITPEGIFRWLQATPTPPLKKAFARTFEFQALQTIFTRTGDPVDIETVFDLMLSSDFQTLQKSVELVRQHPQLTLDTKRDVLMAYVRAGSQIAAQLFVDTDFYFVAKRLSNKDLAQVMELIPQDSQSYQALAAHIQDSLRDIAIVEEQNQTSNTKKIHTVADGDTLWDISRHYKISLEDLKQANAIESEYHLRPGNQLIIPQG